ncbi:MAG: DMT family transporter [Eubacteriales bacterium]
MNIRFPILKEVNNKKIISYIGIILVVIVWGIDPIVALELNKYYSPTFRIVAAQLILIPVYLMMSSRHLRSFSKDYLKVGIPMGLFLALANVAQKIGLQYTTPAKYAFLENLSCITVPIFMFFFIHKKPTFTTLLSCGVCIASTVVLNADSFNGGQMWGGGEILCGIAGLFYGINIAGTGAFAKKLYAPLYLAVQATVELVVSLAFSLILNFVTVPDALGDSQPLEKIVFSLEIQNILFLVSASLISLAFCWTIRTNSMKYVEASNVAVIMPFSAVITSIVSVILGSDRLSTNLIVGGILGLLAIILSEFDDIVPKKNKNTGGIQNNEP